MTEEEISDKEKEFLLLSIEEKKHILGEAIDNFFLYLKDKGVSYQQYVLLVHSMATANLNGTPNDIETHIVVMKDKRNDLSIEKDKIQ